MKKNERKIRERRLRRRRWFIYQNGRKQYPQSNFRSEGIARAFLRSIELNDLEFQFIKMQVMV